jgi:hypothetical protein
MLRPCPRDWRTLSVDGFRRRRPWYAAQNTPTTGAHRYLANIVCGFEAVLSNQFLQTKSVAQWLRQAGTSWSPTSGIFYLLILVDGILIRPSAIAVFPLIEHVIHSEVTTACGTKRTTRCSSNERGSGHAHRCRGYVCGFALSQHHSCAG